MTNETPPPFVPFAPNFKPPQTDAPPLQPEQAPAKPPRKKREKKSAAPAGEGRTMQEAKQPRQRRRKLPVGVKANKPARKYDLQTILKIAGTLKEADQPVFEKLLGDLSALPKGSRERVLKAFGEVFG